MTSWHSYPSLYAVGHKYIQDLLLDPVLVEEKVDGSQFSFGLFIDQGVPTLKVKSKNKELNLDEPDKMFSKAVEVVKRLEDELRPGWTYRAEYLRTPKHNALEYNRVPSNHLIIFDINTGHEEYMSYEDKQAEAGRLGFECVPLIWRGVITSHEQFKGLIDRESTLGGCYIEGVVVKNYSRFGADKKPLMGKYVSEAYKETAKREWKQSNPTAGDVVDRLVSELATPRRWDKAIEHLRDRGELEGAPQDIGKLLKEIKADVQKEEAEYIKDRLFEYAWPHIERRVINGFPQYYKDKLVQQQFEGV